MAEEGDKAFVYNILATPEGLSMLQLFSAIKSAKLRRRVVELVRAMVEDEEDTGRTP
jgi:hypothetical protein